MGLFTHMLTSFSAAAAASLLNAIWQGAVLAAAVACCLHFVKGISAGVRSILWSAVFLLAAGLHFTPFFYRHAASASSLRTLHLDSRWSVGIAFAWCVLSLVRAVQLIHGAIELRHTARRATGVAPSPGLAPLLRLRHRSAELCTSTGVDRPSVIGFLRPRILIPQAIFEKIPASELEQIVMHEMEHLRRADDWTNLIQKVSLVLFPLNPVLMFVERRLCAERELACDDRVLQLTRARKAYATCLVNLAEHSMLRRGAELLLGAWDRQSELARRVHRIVGQPDGVMSRRRLQFVTSILLLAVAGGTFMLSREPQLVSFFPVASGLGESALHHAAYVPASIGARAQSAPSTTPKMVDAVFHEPLRKPAPPQEKPASTAKPRIRKATRPMFKSASFPIRELKRRQSQAYVILTGWTDSPLPSGMRLVVSDGIYSYAAVPTPAGWLIVQL